MGPVDDELSAAPVGRMTDTQEWSRLRSRLLCPSRQAIRLANLYDTSQSLDIGKPINYGGFGRIHHFSEQQRPEWIADPLPAVPAARKLGCSVEEARVAQIFQIPACNLRCWYCFVDYSSLSPEACNTRLFDVCELVRGLPKPPGNPRVLDLSGGNPGLVPEWLLWTVRALRDERRDDVMLWVDDNLTVSLYSSVLSSTELQEIIGYPLFSSVGCFKGFDDESFAFNSGRPKQEFASQFRVFESLFNFGWDIYAYVTFTCPTTERLPDRMRGFVDLLQDIDENLPLRTVPLEIRRYSPMEQRIDQSREEALGNQYEALALWNAEIENRFCLDQRTKPICDIAYSRRGSSCFQLKHEF